MVDGNCNSCVYFVDHKMMGVCQRYPNFAHRHSTEWCGEYKAIPKVDQPTVEVIGEKQIQFVRKPGRPAKVAT